MENKNNIDMIVKEYPIKKTQPQNKITYEDIIKNLGMQTVEGKLYFMNEKTKTQMQEEPIVQAPKNSYIYNKYFKDNTQKSDTSSKPMNIIEYRNMLIRNIINNYKMKQIKSKKINIPIERNFHNIPYDQNKLFDFSNKINSKNAIKKNNDKNKNKNKNNDKNIKKNINTNNNNDS